jgi:hypothetical protein
VRAVALYEHVDRRWQFIHGRSAQTNVRSMPQVYTKHRGTWCQQRHWQSSVANDSAARECPQLPQRRNCTGPDPKSRQSASTGPATTWPALAPTLAAEDWQFIHNPVATPGATAIWGAGSSGTSPDPQGRYKASTALAPHQGAANRSRHTPAFRLRTKQI